MRAGRSEIARCIPQREPFFFLDEVVTLDRDRRARALLRLTGEEPYFAGHFPGDPMLPGVLLLEHMAQTANYLVAQSGGASSGRRMLLAGVDRARFLEPVRPPAELWTDVTVIKLFETMGMIEAVSRVHERTVARANFQFAAMKESDVLATR